MEIVLGAVDHYVRVANNYYLYFNEPSNRWIYIPTDFDYTLIDTLGPDCANNSFLAVCQQFLNVEAFTDIATTTAFDNGVAPHWAGRFFYPNYPRSCGISCSPARTTGPLCTRTWPTYSTSSSTGL